MTKSGSSIEKGSLAGPFFVICAASLWGTTGTAQALAPTGAEPLVVAGIRQIIGGIALVLLALGRGKFKATDRLPRGQVVLNGVLIALYQVFFFAGVARTGVAIGSLVSVGVAPIVAGTLNYMLGREPVGRRWLASTAISLVGLVLLCLQSGEVRVDFAGVGFALAAGVCYASYTVFLKDLLLGRDTDRVIGAVFMAGALIIFPFMWGRELGWVLTGPGATVALHLGLIATALAYVFFGRGLRTVPSPTAVTLSLAEPFTATCLGVFLLGEVLSTMGMAGIALLFGGLVLLATGQVSEGART